MDATIIVVQDNLSSDELLPGQTNDEDPACKKSDIQKVRRFGNGKQAFLQPVRSRNDSKSCPDLAYLPNIVPESPPESPLAGKDEEDHQFKRKDSYRPTSKIWSSIHAVVHLRSIVSSKRRGSKKKKNATPRTDSFLEKFTTRQTHAFDENDADRNNGNGPEEGKSDDEFELLSFILEPDGDFIFYWLFLLSVAVLYNFWFLIAREAWIEIQTGAPALWFSLDYSCDLIYILDIIVQFRTGYLEHGLLVKSSERLALHYVKSFKFWADVFSLLPTDFFYLVVGVHTLLRFPRFFKVYRVSQFYYKVETSTVHPNSLRVINLIHILFLLTHWFAAIYFILGEMLGATDGIWSYQYIGDEGQNTTVRKYLSSIYWSAVTLTTIGDIPNPQSDWQFVFQIIGYMLGVFLFATIVGQVGTVIENRNALRMEFERQVDHTKKYMHEHKVPRDIRQTVLRWYDHTWNSGHMRGRGDVNTLSLLPSNLRTELALHVNLDILKKVTFFQECPPEFLHELVLKMRFNIICPGDLVIRKGQIAREMFIIADGLLEVLGDDGRVLATLETGDYFGEIGILNIGGISNRRTADVRSVGYSELFTLVKEDILGLLVDFPQAEAVIQQEAKMRLKRSKTEGDQPEVVSVPSATSGRVIENMRKSGIFRSPSARRRQTRSHLTDSVEMVAQSEDTSPVTQRKDEGTKLPTIRVHSSDDLGPRDVNIRSDLAREVLSSIEDIITTKLEKISKDNKSLRTRNEQLEAQIRRLQETNEKKTDEIMNLRKTLKLRPSQVIKGPDDESNV